MSGSGTVSMSGMPRRSVRYVRRWPRSLTSRQLSSSMEIWRMRSDGGGAEQLTRDEHSNWFPHPSPDGRWVVFLTYLEDQGDAHPFGRQVKLRLLDTRDDSVRDLTAPFFGGQGTLNVPSWSPDSSRVAYVAYSVQ